MSNPTTRDASPVVAETHGIEVLAAPHLTNNILRQVRGGDYERPEIEAGLANLRDEDCAVELGSGAGIVGTVLTKNVNGFRVRAFDANPNLIEHARTLYKHNGVDDRITVEHQVVIPDGRGPKTMEFQVRDNFLGSRLSAVSDTDAGQKVSVSTIGYNKLTKEYPHNVLIMDIEGAELDFFKKANLSKLDLIMVELHPNAYGREGIAQIDYELRQKGFFRDEVTTQGNVVSYKTKERAGLPVNRKVISTIPPETFYKPDPQKPVADQIIVAEKAVLAKHPNVTGFTIAAAVFDQDRRFIPEATCWVSERLHATTGRPHPRARNIKPLPGSWLFGGRYHPHFGHFLTESLARLWALDHVKEHLDGVIFIPAYDDYETTAPESFAQFSSIFNRKFVWKISEPFCEVERLVIAPQANGIGELILGTPDFREFIVRHLRRDLPRLDCKKLYISRSQMTDKTRHYLGEKKLERMLADEGYLIFHPQEHSWESQLQHYLSAEVIVGAEGSPFHLVNYTGRPDLKIAVLQRRYSPVARSLVEQAALFGLGEARLVNAMSRIWSLAGIRRADLMLISEIKFSRVCDELIAGGFLPPNAAWEDLTDAEIHEELAATGQRYDSDIYQVHHGATSLSDKPKMINPGAPQVFFSEAKTAKAS